MSESEAGKYSGYPWHLEYAKKKEHDPRRDKRWCAYYACNKENYCVYKNTVCQGSTYCKQYRKREESEPKAVIKKEMQKHPVLPESKRELLEEKGRNNRRKRKK